MADGTKIEWTDATWNVVNGCSVTSPGCTNCYAMRLAGTRLRNHPSRAGLTQMTKAGPVWTGETRFNEGVLLDPLKWKRPRKIFVCAHGDLFHESVPDEWIDRVFAVMALCPQHVFQVLTKRSDRMHRYVTEFAAGGRFACDWVCRILAGRPDGGYDTALAKDQEQLRAAIRRCGGSPFKPFVMPNLWLGVSVEDQARAEERIPDLLATPAAVRFLSCEPLLGSLDLTFIDLAKSEARQKEPSGLVHVDALTGIHWDFENGDVTGVYGDPDPHIDWVIVGGESGPGARPMHPDWARSLRDQCATASVPFHFKQWGGWVARDQVAGALDECGWPNRRDLSMAWPDGTTQGGTMHQHSGPGMPLYRIGKNAAGRLLDGVEHNGSPYVVQFRQAGGQIAEVLS